MSSISSGADIEFSLVISFVCFVSWLNLLFISLFVPTSFSVNSCKLSTSTLYIPFTKSVNSYSPCAFVVVLPTSALLLFNNLTITPLILFSELSIVPFLLLSSHTVPCIFLLTTCDFTVPVCICSESTYTCAIALLAYTFSTSFSLVFIVTSISNFVFPAISPFNANPFACSFIVLPISFSFHILDIPIPVSFAVIFLTSVASVVYSFKFSFSCTVSPIVCTTLTLSNVYEPTNLLLYITYDLLSL